MQCLLGIDIGSSSVKASLVSIETGESVAHDFMPKQEMAIVAHRVGWAEQDPEEWFVNMKSAIAHCMTAAMVEASDIKGIGISYQMHGLVLVDKNLKVLRPAIIWCDSRAIPYGERALETLGVDYCLSHLLNAPGNFTASKMAWVKAQEPKIFDQTYKFLLPGDYIAMRLTDEITTTISGLSEGIFWDFKEEKLSLKLLEAYGFSREIVPDIVPTFSIQGRITKKAAKEIGLAEGTPVCYRAGDQPNNAFSLNVMSPGEIAATGGTSGVVYGVLGHLSYDKLSRVNTFAHVNHGGQFTRLGVLLCVNGTGSLNAWLKRNIATEGLSYSDMNELALTAPIGAEGLSIIPFGNGAERVLQNSDIGASIHGINFNLHTRAHILRAAQEGIAFSFAYGIELMKSIGLNIRTINAGHANLFLSPLFRKTLTNITQTTIQLYDTNGAIGAARGAGIGCGIYKNSDEAFATLHLLATETPEGSCSELISAYDKWKYMLTKNTN